MVSISLAAYITARLSVASVITGKALDDRIPMKAHDKKYPNSLQPCFWRLHSIMRGDLKITCRRKPLNLNLGSQGIHDIQLVDVFHDLRPFQKKTHAPLKVPTY